MHVHLPKPLHGWREFAGEVGIIVLGVLIALGFEQLVDGVRWHRNVVDVTQSLNAELETEKFNGLQLIAGEDCRERKLDRLETIVDHGDVQTDISVGLFGLRTWSTAAWEAATASGAVAHMNPDTRNRYASLYGLARVLGDLNAKAYDATSRVSTLDRHKQLTDVSRDRLEVDLAELRKLNLILAEGSRQFIAQAEPLHLELTPDDRIAFGQVREALRKCPMPDAPPTKQS